MFGCCFRTGQMLGLSLELSQGFHHRNSQILTVACLSTEIDSASWPVTARRSIPIPAQNCTGMSHN